MKVVGALCTALYAYSPVGSCHAMRVMCCLLWAELLRAVLYMKEEEEEEECT